ncbi:hypothetical protein pdam_00008355, partial [Pocillopora damicornis]
MKVCRDSFAFLIRSTFEIIKIKNLVTGVLRKSIKIRSQLYMADSQVNEVVLLFESIDTQPKNCQFGLDK